MGMASPCQTWSPGMPLVHGDMAGLERRSHHVGEREHHFFPPCPDTSRDARPCHLGWVTRLRGAVAIPLSLSWVCCSSETALNPSESPLKRGQWLPLCVHTCPGRVACTHTSILTPQLPVTLMPTGSPH